MRNTSRAVVLLIVSLVAALLVSEMRLAKPAPAEINVRWAAGITSQERSELERRFTLIEGSHREGTSWQYVLQLETRKNISALVQHPAVQDTHYIDRTNYVVVRDDDEGFLGSRMLSSLALGIGLWLLLLALWMIGRKTFGEVSLTAFISTWSRWIGKVPVLLIVSLVAALLISEMWPAKPAPAEINVRWAAGITSQERSELERRFTLIEGSHREGTSWQYVLQLETRKNISALVQHPAVQDTHYIDRTNYVVVRDDDEGFLGSRMLSSLALGIGVWLVLLALWMIGRKTFGKVSLTAFISTWSRWIGKAPRGVEISARSRKRPVASRVSFSWSAWVRKAHRTLISVGAGLARSISEMKSEVTSVVGEARLERLAGFLVNTLLVVGAATLTLVVVDQALAPMGYADQWHILTREPNVKIDETGLVGGISFSSNSHGFRYQDIDYVRKPGQRRGLVIGDSLTEGHHVNAEDRFTDQLERRFGHPVINMGMGGKEPRWYYLVYEEIGYRYEPDWVLICLFVNDVYEAYPGGARPDSDLGVVRRQMQAFNPLELTLRWTAPRTFVLLQKMFGFYVDPWPMIRARVSPSGTRNDGTRTDEAPLTQVEQTVRSAKMNSNLSDDQVDTWLAGLSSQTRALINAAEMHDSIFSVGLFNPDYWRVSLDLYNESAEMKWQTTAEWLQRIFGRIRKSGARPLLAFLPHPVQYDPEFLRAEYLETGAIFRAEWLVEETALQQRLSEVAHGSGVSFLDLTPGFRAYKGTKEDLYLPFGDPHFGVAGHELTANLMEEWLRGLGVSTGIQARAN